VGTTQYPNAAAYRTAGTQYAARRGVPRERCGGEIPQWLSPMASERPRSNGSPMSNPAVAARSGTPDYHAGMPTEAGAPDRDSIPTTRSGGRELRPLGVPEDRRAATVVGIELLEGIWLPYDCRLSGSAPQRVAARRASANSGRPESARFQNSRKRRYSWRAASLSPCCSRSRAISRT